MKKRILVVALFGTLLSGQSLAYTGSSFNQVWDVISEKPYRSLPHKQVTLGGFWDRGVNLLRGAAKRTTSNKNDILPYFEKLLHPNGICLAGEWMITRDNPYSGYFKNGSEALIIARASTTLSNTERGSYRGFGLAGKVFPTINKDRIAKTGNFFLIDNLIGTYAKNFTRVDLTNQPGVFPPFSFSVPFLIPVGVAATRALSAADINPGIRQVYSLSNLGLKGGEESKTPKWMKFTGSSLESTSNKRDFRNELLDHLEKNGSLTFDISVASSLNSSGKKNWKKVGKVTFKDALASVGCDHRLHFHHHRFKSNAK